MYIQTGMCDENNVTAIVNGMKDANDFTVLYIDEVRHANGQDRYCIVVQEVLYVMTIVLQKDGSG